MPCQFPEHHGSSHHSSRYGLLAVVLVVVLVAEVGKHATAIGNAIVHGIELVAIGFGILAAAVVLVLAAVFTLRHVSVRHVLAAVKVRARWRHLCRNLGLSKVDVRSKDRGRVKVRHLRVRVRPDRYGVTATFRTRPGTGRAEVDEVAEHLADAWQVARVSVSQPKAGRVRVRGLRVDPLTIPLSMAAVPGSGQGPGCPYLGLDEWAQHRYLSLADTPGILIGGQPGRGKSVLLSSFLYQWASSPEVQWVQLDGKGSSDLADFTGRAWLHCADDLAEAVAVLEDVHALMVRRLRSVLEVTGRRNSWHAGPSADWPMVVIVIDECQQYLDVASYKGDPKAEALARRAVALTGQLVRRGRSAMLTTVLATQKCTTDSVPSSISSNCGVSLCFGVKTTEAAAAVLGPDIREYPSFSPIGLQDDEFTGVVTSNLRTGKDPFTRVRTPLLTDEMVTARAAETAGLRRDPSTVREPVMTDA